MKIYTENFPTSLSSAIYTYGDNSFPIISYGEIDETHGYLLSETSLCLNFDHLLQINLEHIQNLQFIYGTQGYSLVDTLSNKSIHSHLFQLIYQLEVHDYHVTFKMDDEHKILFYIYYILSDLENDNYEDIERDDMFFQKQVSYFEKIDQLCTLNNQDYSIELTLFLDNFSQYIEQLEIDSDEVDIYYSLLNSIVSKSQKQFEHYQDILKDNPHSFDSILGYSLDDLKNKSPEELNNLLDDLCNKFNINKDSLMKLGKKFQQK